MIDSFASFAAADACGAFGDGPLPGEAGTIGCDVLRRNGKIAVGQARGNAFGMPGYFSWGTTATNGGSGALAALATAAPQGLRRRLRGRRRGPRLPARAQPVRAQLRRRLRPAGARHPHTWASVFGAGKPRGAVVGGPAPPGQVYGQGFEARGRLNSRFAAYEDRLNDYVTSEPAIDYAAASVLMLAALTAHCQH